MRPEPRVPSVPVKDPDGYLARSRAYEVWRKEPTRVLSAPMDYSFLTTYPNNFKKIREEFEMYWAVKRLTR